MNVRTKRWWETDFINTYCQLLAHSIHSPDKLFVSSYHPKELLHRALTRSIKKDCHTVLTVANKDNMHFAGISVDVPTRQISILDGLPGRSRDWLPHILNLLKRCRLLELDDNGSESIFFVSDERDFIGGFDDKNLRHEESCQYCPLL